jgi:hypothetical protein
VTFTVNPEDQQATTRPAVQHTLTFTADANLQDLWDSLGTIFNNHTQSSGLPDSHAAAFTELAIQPDGTIAGTLVWTW